MTRSRILLFTPVAAALLAGGAALAGTAAGPPSAYPARGPIPFTTLDVNGDGRVSVEEFDATHQARWAQRAQQPGVPRHAPRPAAFADIDRDADGVLSADELADYRQQRQQQRQQQRMAQRPRCGGRGPAR